MKQESITKLVKDILDWWEKHECDEVPVGDDEWDNQYDNPIFVLEAQRLSARIEANSISPKTLRIEGTKLAEQVAEDWKNELETQRGWAVYRLEQGDDREPTCVASENETFVVSARDVLAQTSKPQHDDSHQP
jgi:hypothetical protein